MRPQTGKSARRELWGGMLAVLATLTVGVLIACCNTPAYKRYVSHPLKDGSRYTFLYPLNSKVDELGGTTDGVGDTTIYGVRVDSEVEKKPLLYLLLVPLGMPRQSQHSSLLVSFLAPDKSSSLHKKRSEEWFTEKGVRYHSVYLPATGTGLVVELMHWEISPPPALFQQIDAVVSSSFRLLPPGTSPPSP